MQIKVGLERNGSEKISRQCRVGNEGDEEALHYGSKQGEIETLNYTLSHEQGSERSERASERVSAAERASEASSAEQANV